MFQELFRIPGLNIPIYGYGVMLVIGFFAAMELAKFLARRSGLDPEIFATAALLALVAGVAGARISHVLENWPQYSTIDKTHTFWTNLWDAVNIRSGGLTYYGGFILAFPTVVAYGMRKKVPIRLGMDIVAPCLMIGLGFGRIGCYLNGCCYGAECNASWAPGVEFPYYSNAYIDEFEKNELRWPIARELLVPATPLTDYLDSTHQNALQEPVPDAMARYLRGAYLKSRTEAGRLADADLSNRLHPAQLYSAFTGFLLAALLLAYFTLPHAPGRVFALMMIAEGTCRFLLEIIRAEPPLRIGPDFVTRFHGIDFSLGMIEALGIIAAGAISWFIFGAAAGTAPPTIQSESRMATASPMKNRSDSPTVIA